MVKMTYAQRARARRNRVRARYAMAKRRILRSSKMLKRRVEERKRLRAMLRIKENKKLAKLAILSKRLNVRTPNNKSDLLRRRLERMSLNGGSHTRIEWIALKASFGNKCAFCGSEEKVQRDHILPICKGGRDSIDNIQPLCWRCNFRKGPRIISKDQFLLRYKNN